MRYVQIFYVLALAVVLGALAPCAQAVSLPVANHSFEADVLPLDGDYIQPPASWTTTGAGTGAQNPAATTYSTAAGASTPTGADAVNAAFAAVGKNSLAIQSFSQDIAGSSMELGHTYTLTVAIGDPANRLPMGTWNIGLHTTGLGALLADVSGVGGDLTNDAFVDKSVSYTAVAGDVGMGLAVYFQGKVDVLTAGAKQIDFDNVRLTDVVVPEPSTLFLLTAGLLACGLQRRK